MRSFSRRGLLAGASIVSASAMIPSTFAHSSSTLDGSAFGLSGSAGEDGSGPDETNALQSFFDELARRNYTQARIPPGRYRITRPLKLISSSIGTIIIDAHGAEFVFDIPEPEMRRAYLWIGNPARTGRQLQLTGLTARLNRPAIRTPHSDMIRLIGFRDYFVADISIPSADNMGLTIGRGDPLGWTPDSIVVENSSFGGRREAQPHSYGSIGDSAVWIISPAAETRVSGCRVRETGDDGIFVGHSNSRSISSIVIRDNTLSDTCGGIGTAMPNTEIVGNRLNRTNVFAIRCEWQNGNQGSEARIVDNEIISAGQMEAGDIAAGMIRKMHPHAIFIYEPVGRVRIENNRISRTRGCALALLPHNEAPLTDVVVEGGTYSEIGVDRNGRPQRGSNGIAVFRRAPSQFQSVNRFSAQGPVVIDTQQPLLFWSMNGTEGDSGIAVRNARLIDCDLTGTALVQVRSRVPMAGVDLQVTYSAENSKIPTDLSTNALAFTQGVHVSRR